MKNSVNENQNNLTETVSGLSGRALDAAIAECVMGFTRAPDPPHSSDNRTINGVLYYLPDHPWDAGQHNVVPYFSSDIADAWQIVEHFQKQDCMMSVNAHSANGGWWSVIYPADGGYIESPTCDSAPKAICRAALALVSLSDTGTTKPEQP